MLGAAVTFPRTIGLTVQAATGTLHHWTPDNPAVPVRQTTVHVGARLGSTAGLFGIGGGVVAAIGVLALILA